MQIITIGSSTGGPRVLFELFGGLPVIDAAILLVQHMPVSTTPRLAKRLSELTRMQVIVPRGGENLEKGTLYVTPGDRHLVLTGNNFIQLSDSEKVNFVRPSVDVTLLSLEHDTRSRLMGIILSGMGNDGAMGMSHLKYIGGTTIVQDPKSCTIRSMPESAIRTGKIDKILVPAEIRALFLSEFSQK